MISGDGAHADVGLSIGSIDAKLVAVCMNEASELVGMGCVVAIPCSCDRSSSC